MNRLELREMYDYAAKRDEKIDELQRLLMSLGVAGLSIATPLFASAGMSGPQAVVLKAALLAITLGVLSSGVRLYFGVRVAKYNVAALYQQHVDGRYGDAITVPKKARERTAEGAAYAFYIFGLVLMAASCFLS